MIGVVVPHRDSVLVFRRLKVRQSAPSIAVGLRFCAISILIDIAALPLCVVVVVVVVGVSAVGLHAISILVAHHLVLFVVAVAGLCVVDKGVGPLHSVVRHKLSVGIGSELVLGVVQCAVDIRVIEGCALAFIRLFVDGEHETKGVRWGTWEGLERAFGKGVGIGIESWKEGIG